MDLSLIAMKKTLLLIFAAASLCGSFTRPLSPSYEIDILQNGEILEVDEQVVKLKKAPFTIRVKLFGLDGVFMNASTDKSLFELEDGDAIPDLTFIESKTMAEPAFYEDKVLSLSNGLYSYLFYDPDQNWHRFDSVTVLNGQVTGIKKVENLFNMESGKSEPVEKAKKNIYLFFVSISKGQNGQAVELKRHKIMLRWD